MEHREGRTRLEAYEREVVGILRRRLIDEGLETPMGDSGYRIHTKDVRLESRGSGYGEAVVLFRMAGREGSLGFRFRAADGPEAADPENPSFDPPDGFARVILANLDEAILSGEEVGPDSEGVTWLR